jgi:hypothetical protein
VRKQVNPVAAIAIIVVVVIIAVALFVKKARTRRVLRTPMGMVDPETGKIMQPEGGRQRRGGRGGRGGRR